MSTIVIRAAGVDEEDLRPEAGLAELGIDSIARVEIAIRIEDELGVRITDEDITPSTTLGQLETLIDSRRSGV
nr:acyl carrier protein [Corynebacterium mendelii]